MENKKELAIRTQKIGAYEIYYVGGGPVPTSLQGIWNRKIIAQQAIDHHLYLQKLETDKQAAKVAELDKKASDNRAAIKAKAEAKKAKKVKVESVDGEGQARV